MMFTRAQLVTHFGDPGLDRASVDPAWVKANIVTARDGNGDVPGMPGVPSRYYFQVHRRAEPAMRAAFAAARAAAPDYVIERAGCFVFRHERHDPSRPLSRHSWGIAVDIDADQNSARQFRGEQPEPWSPAWLEIWPHGLPRAFVEAFEQAGFVWGGRWRGFVDPMHFELRP